VVVANHEKSSTSSTPISHDFMLVVQQLKNLPSGKSMRRNLGSVFVIDGESANRRRPFS